MRIKLFSSPTRDAVQKEVNEWIATLEDDGLGEVTDISFSQTSGSTPFGIAHAWNVMVVWKDNRG